MDNAQIFQQLQNYDNFGITILASPPLPIPELAEIWEWNTRTGLPIFGNPERPWSRYVVDSLMNQQLRDGLESNSEEFRVTCSGNMKRKFLGDLLKSDIKKIRVVDDKNDIIIRKTLQQLLPFDDVYGEGPLKTTKNDSTNPKTVPDLLIEVNRNAARGYTGPGTFRCREGHCLVTGPNISGTPNSIQWGPQPHHNLPLRKRFNCQSNNVVYMIHCVACIRNGNWSTYIGSTNSAENIHQRFSQHKQIVCDQTLREWYPPPNLEATVLRRLNGEEDDDDLLQDPYIHFTYVHTHDDKRYTLLDGNFPTDRCKNRCESYYKLVCGNYEYDPYTLSGSLNRKN